jgi:tetratricopeptide (TPR) repeat protein
MSIEQALQVAIAHHKAGRLAEAEHIYRQVLSQRPNDPTALHFLGLVAHQMGQHAAAVDLIRRAIECHPDYSEAYGNLGVALYHLGRFDEAVAACRKSIQLKPTNVEACNNLGNSLTALGKLDEAVAAYLQAIQHRPDFAEAYNNLGIALKTQGKLEAAVAAYRKSVQLRPGVAEVYSNLGVAFHDLSKFDEAAGACMEAIRLNPLYADGYYNLGNAFKSLRNLDEAESAYRRAIELKPAHAEAYSNLGVVLHDQSKLQEAAAAFRKAIEFKPDCFEAYNNLGIAFLDEGDLDTAIELFNKAVRKLDYGEAHWNLAVGSLLKGDFSRGWREFEWRWKWKDFPSPVRNFSQPQWLGEDVVGRRVLLHAEQGLGDTIQFVRYASQVTARGATVILECPPELFRLLKDLPGIHQTIIAGQSLPEFDLQCPLLSLPLAFGTQLESIPCSIPYIPADPQLAQTWIEEIADKSPDLKVGLVWAGSPIHTKNKRRSMELRQFSPLSAVRGVKFYSLQKGAPAKQLHDSDVGLKLNDLTHKLTDFADTAAVIANLDLVITVDTAVAHLAGAMGKPVWVLLPFVPDWRWMMDREDSPWYPTMRLFRQKAAGQWDEVIERVVDCLARLAEP